MDSNVPFYWHDLALTFDKGQNPDGARVCFGRAISLDPDWVEPYVSRGRFLARMGKIKPAIQDFYRTLSLDPDKVEVFYYLAYCQFYLGDFETCKYLLGIARQHNSHKYDVQLLESFLDFKAGRLGEAFSKYWVRRKTFKQMLADHLDEEIPDWYGEDLAGKRIIVNVEQGFGDMIQFVRYLPLLQSSAKEVTLLGRKSLHKLFSNSFPDLRFETDVKNMPDAEYKTLLLDVPQYYSPTVDDVPSTEGYLSPTDDAVNFWSEWLPETEKPLVGIAWAGNKDNSRDVYRSIPVELFKPILSRRDVTLVNLQKESDLINGIGTLLNPAEHLIDFDRTAGLITQLDLVITVDTSIAHLAGAIGKSVWIALDISGDWRWMNDSDRSYWYDSARIFRQTEFCKWDDVIARIEKALDAFVDQRSVCKNG